MAFDPIQFYLIRLDAFLAGNQGCIDRTDISLGHVQHNLSGEWHESHQEVQTVHQVSNAQRCRTLHCKSG